MAKKTKAAQKEKLVCGVMVPTGSVSVCYLDGAREGTEETFEEFPSGGIVVTGVVAVDHYKPDRVFCKPRGDPLVLVKAERSLRPEYAQALGVFQDAAAYSEAEAVGILETAMALLVQELVDRVSKSERGTPA